MASRSTNSVEVWNSALVKVGLPVVASFEGLQPTQITAKTSYEDLVLACMGSATWNFLKEQVALDRLSETPLIKWTGAYQLPTNLLTLRGVYINGYRASYDRYSDMVFCDAGVDDAVVADTLVRKPEGKWPPQFTGAVILKLAGLAASSIKRDDEEGAALDRAGDRALALYASQAAQERTPTRIDVSTFIRARRTGPTGGGVIR